ncbi:SpdA protein [Streptomyces sp. NBC_00038]|uniref:SpdA protein n=1 Tax=Streptomyces sp. NBC_00038 TaxID=2903615 RepID=UPI0022563EBF|nr:SpdA protein [Streptomyces sp. NBC_00038]MCX5562025.1 SpdA protein [Streptomyces sp. NBC_00038]
MNPETRPNGILEQGRTLRAVTATMATVIGLTFLFGFGNVWTLALRLGVPAWVAPLVAPAVDLSVLGLLLGIRHLALHGATPEQLRPARRLLIFSSVMTLALNVTDPLLSGDIGKAAFDAVGPLLLIGWAEVGPGLLQAISSIQSRDDACPTRFATGPHLNEPAEHAETDIEPTHHDLLQRARREDTRHRELHQRPISAETLRKQLHIGAAKSRMLVAVIRNDRSR